MQSNFQAVTHHHSREIEEPAPLYQGHLSQLDGVRGFACLFVLLHHYFTGVMELGSSGHLSTLEKLCRPFLLSGVDLFFVLSGYLIGGIVLDHHRSPRFFKTFYLRRMCRIFPVYYLLCLTFVIALVCALPEHYPSFELWLLKDPMPLWSYLTFTQNFTIAGAGHAGGKWMAITWSLAVEEQFYLVLPLLVWAVPRKWVRSIIVGAVILAPICRLVALEFNWFASYVLLPCRMDTLLMGVLVADLVRSERAREFVINRPAALYLCILFPLILLLAHHLEYYSAGTMTFSLLAVMYAAIILLVIEKPGGALSRCCKQRAIVKLGALSYFVYMFHQLINGAMHALLFNSQPQVRSLAEASATMLSAAIVLLLAQVSLTFFENPLRNIGKRYSY